VRTWTCTGLRADGRCSHEAAPYRYREAELKHGRVAMLAAWGMITQDMWHPLFNGKLSANPLLAIVQVRSQPRSPPETNHALRTRVLGKLYADGC
jgi:hypothetical protein